MAAVEFRNVDVIFGKQPKTALKLLDEGQSREEILNATGNVLGVADANLTVERGEICVLMGLSGSGKSSLLRCVNGLNKVTRGELLIEHGDGHVDMASITASQLRELRMNRIAMVFQQFGLLPWDTVRDNVGFGLDVKGVPKAEIRKIVDEKLELVHLSNWADNYVHELSGGMQQRVGLARAFATDADILLMDEPFSALDPLIREHLQDELIELQERLKKTIIFVSHDLDEALKIGDKIVIMDGGRIIQAGRAEDIVFRPENEYVRKFVANINPLNVLYGSVLMKPFEAAALRTQSVSLAEGVTLTLDSVGRPVSVVSQACEVPVVSYLSENHTGDVAFSVDRYTWMKDIVKSAKSSAFPLIVTQDDRVIGMIGEDEIYDGLLHQA